MIALGIPNGELPVVEKNVPRKGCGLRVDEFRSQFNTSRISVTLVKKAIEESKEAGRIFTTNFLVIITTLLGETTQCTTINQKCINFLEEDAMLSKMDWCGYIINCLKRTKASWKGAKDQYTGPIVLLAVLYTHVFNKRHNIFDCESQVPAIKYINTELLQKMDKHLSAKGALTDDEKTADDQIVGKEKKKRIGKTREVNEKTRKSNNLH